MFDLNMTTTISFIGTLIIGAMFILLADWLVDGVIYSKWSKKNKK